ncbi:hypothetical protein MXM33_01165 [Acinetobacter vivianii]|jgi:hypothetical protein|nr:MULTISPECIES: hypothetical protein [Acinetobacter]MEB6665638.1 hypothetical protein [Acinetobacter vivianii]
MKKVLLTVATLLTISTSVMATDFTPKAETGFIGGKGCGFSCTGGGR